MNKTQRMERLRSLKAKYEAAEDERDLAAIAQAEKIVKACLPKGWSLCLAVGWGASVAIPGKPQGQHVTYSHIMEDLGHHDIADLMKFADEVMEKHGGTNEWIKGEA